MGNWLNDQGQEWQKGKEKRKEINKLCHMGKWRKYMELGLEISTSETKPIDLWTWNGD